MITEAFGSKTLEGLGFHVMFHEEEKKLEGGVEGRKLMKKVREEKVAEEVGTYY